MTLRKITPIVAAIGIVAGSAFGQTPAGVQENGPGTLDVVVALGVMVIVCFAGFLNSKRSHQT